MGTKLSVNINKIALLRNSRGVNYPNLLKVALDIQSFGADGITVHPRPDERHVKYNDLQILKDNLSIELNVEGNPDKKFMEIVLKVKPQQVTLVPDAPNALTSSAGWDTITNQSLLKDICHSLKEQGIRSSIFISSNPAMVHGALESNADRVELYTEEYAKQYALGNLKAIQPYLDTAFEAQKLSLGLNAGHDLNLDNLKYFSLQLPNLLEVSIGHALVVDSLYLGLENTIRMYKRLIS